MPKMIDKFNDYNEAKIEAAKEYLMEYLDFDLNELNTFKITDMQVSGKGDNVLYIAIVLKILK